VSIALIGNIARIVCGGDGYGRSHRLSVTKTFWPGQALRGRRRDPFLHRRPLSAHERRPAFVERDAARAATGRQRRRPPRPHHRATRGPPPPLRG